ncbi:hypothetical protein Acsp04_02110 [Actinomadura sp. NBRC 104425]|uniref:DUF4282 domain-containing protein n=1 Tax=Actinomadura sp. NBRC 104425 TaxID=3032204 RepID=UPI0024A35017|nr:DUF4282 domain-containing protein [Actinomadura sp. NBRC 104425]GLZ09976.1 hypothetical protein Acsp04_02110 [Actinomadura sp. NBRC 104425]
MTNPPDPGQYQRPPAPPGAPYMQQPQPQPAYGAAPGAPGAGQAAFGRPGGTGGVPENKGLFGALFDANFDHLVTPKLIKLCYVLALLLVTLSALMVLVIGVWVFQLRNGWLLGLLIMLCAPVIWIFEAVLVRIFMEAVVVRFKGVEHLRVIKDKI